MALSGTGVENIGQIVVQVGHFISYNPTATWSNGTNDQLAFCGWWYGKQEFDSGGSTEHMDI